MSFALAASTFCPLLLLGIWWRGLTWVGAMAGLVVGGGLVIVAQVVVVISSYTGRWAPSVLSQPALVTVPVAFLTMVMISRLTARRRPDDVNQILLRLHAPDPLGFMRDRESRFGTAGRARRVRPTAGTPTRAVAGLRSVWNCLTVGVWDSRRGARPSWRGLSHEQPYT